MSETDPNDPPPPEDPTHDVPVYPEHDPPPEGQTPIKAAGKTPARATRAARQIPVYPARARMPGTTWRRMTSTPRRRIRRPMRARGEYYSMRIR